MAAAAMRPGPPVEPSRRRPPRRQHSHQQQLHRERDRQQQHWLHLSRLRPNGGNSSRALLVLLLLASSPLVLGLAEPPGSPTTSATRATQCQLALPSQGTMINRTMKSTNLTIGYLTAIKGGMKDRQGLAISGALTMALDEVNLSFIDAYLLKSIFKSFHSLAFFFHVLFPLMQHVSFFY